MKRSLLLLCATLIAVAAPLAPARADDSVSIDFFYDALSPYGDWIYTPNYGYVWQPLVAQQPGWSPYADGSWAYTDAGWTWISNEDFGWLTYHYGRWILMQQSWVWVPGYEWAPAWVSWRQTQGQIGWAPLPPEAAWSPNTGFGNWTDGYYDVGPSYYNFVPMTAFASASSLLPFILNRSQNYTYYDQSMNITNTSYQQNVMNHIFVGGPDPRRFDGLGGNHLRRLTLRRDDDGFRRDWMDRDHRGNGGPPRGAGAYSRIEQGQLFVAAPSIRRDASHALPSRVREPMHQPVIDRGWRGAGDPQNAERLRQHQHDELARNRPANLPEKNLHPITSTAPPPAFGRDLQAHERTGGGKGMPGAAMPPRHVTEEVRTPPTPKSPLPAGGPPGIPAKAHEEPGGRGAVLNPGLPHREAHPQGQMPGQRPGASNVPVPGGAPQMRQDPAPKPRVIPPQPAAAPPHTPPHTPPPAAPKTAPQPIPNAGGRPQGFPGQHQAPPSAQRPAERPHMQPQPSRPPSAPVTPRVNPAPMPVPHPQKPQAMHPQPPHITPQPRMAAQQPPHVAAQPHMAAQPPRMAAQPHIAPVAPRMAPQPPHVAPPQPHVAPPANVPHIPGGKMKR